MLYGRSIDHGGTEDEVEITGQGLRDRFDAPGAQDLKLAAVGGAEADVLYLRVGATLFAVMLDDQICLSLHGQRGDLSGVFAVV